MNVIKIFFNEKMNLSFSKNANIAFIQNAFKILKIYIKMKLQNFILKIIFVLNAMMSFDYFMNFFY